MPLRKLTIDNSVRYVPKSAKRTETDNKPKKSRFTSSVNKTKNFQKKYKIC